MVYFVKRSAGIQRSHVYNEQCNSEVTMFPDNLVRGSNIYFLISFFPSKIYYRRTRTIMHFHKLIFDSNTLENIDANGIEHKLSKLNIVHIYPCLWHNSVVINKSGIYTCRYKEYIKQVTYRSWDEN